MFDRSAGSRVDLYKLLKEYNKLNGNPDHPNVEHIKRMYDLDLVEEEMRRVQEWIEDIRHFEPKRKREERKEMLRQRIKKNELDRNNKALEMQDIEDRLMRRRASKYVDIDYIYKLAKTMTSKPSVDGVDMERQPSGRMGVFIYLNNGEHIKYEIHGNRGLLSTTPDGVVGWGGVPFDVMKEIMQEDIHKASRH